MEVSTTLNDFLMCLSKWYRIIFTISRTISNVTAICSECKITRDLILLIGDAYRLILWVQPNETDEIGDMEGSNIISTSENR